MPVMFNPYLSLIGAMTMLLTGVVSAISAQQTTTTTPVKTVTQLPAAGCILRQLDGSAICSSERGVFLADGDFRRWSAVPFLSDKMNWGALGGDRRRVFIWTAGSTAGGPNSIEAVQLDGRTAVVRNEMWPGERAVFASKDVGVIYGTSSDRTNVVLTTDGGATWNATPVPFPKRQDAPRAESPQAKRNPAQGVAPGYGSVPPAKGWQRLLQGETVECVGTLHWVSASRLLVGGSQRSVGLFEIQRGTLRPVWMITLPEFAHQFALDGDYAWVANYGAYAGVGECEGAMLHRLRLPEGRMDATVKTALPLVGMAVCHQALLTWDHGTLVMVAFVTPPPASPSATIAAPREPDSLSIWTRDAKGAYVRRGKICTRYLDMAAGHLGRDIAGILPLEAPCCLLVSGQGAGFQLDLDKAVLSPVALQVTPPPPAPVGSNAEIRQLFAVYLSLLSQVPRSEGDAICKEWARKRDPTWGGRVTVSVPLAANGEAGGERVPLRECNLWAIRRLREYLESMKPRVLTLNLATDDDLPHIADLASLEYLSLVCSPVTDAGLAHLQDATELKDLDLGVTLITGSGLLHLKKLTKLRRLVLTSPRTTDAGMAGLKALPQLEALVLTRNDMRNGVELISDAGLINLSQMARLRELDLSGSRITDAGLERLKGFHQLTKLNVSATAVTDAGLAHLTGLTELRWLGLGGAGRSGKMGPNGRTVWTDYGNMRITDAGLKHLTALTQLERLDLFCAHVTDAGLDSLKRLTRLERLSLDGTDVTAEGLKNLQRALPNCQFVERAFW